MPHQLQQTIAQNSTKTSLVPVVYFEMFSLRTIGLTYKQIAEKTGYHEDRIRHIFARGGVLYQLWSEWLEIAKKNSLEEAFAIMFGHLPDIVRTRVLHAKRFDMGAVASSKIILDYTLGRPEKRFNINARAQVATFTDWVKQQTLTKIENKQKTPSRPLS